MHCIHASAAQDGIAPSCGVHGMVFAVHRSFCCFIDMHLSRMGMGYDKHTHDICFGPLAYSLREFCQVVLDSRSLGDDCHTAGSLALHSCTAARLFSTPVRSLFTVYIVNM